jgi:uncharacterized pyridoxamine 5'-phosphate oxidase family protein
MSYFPTEVQQFLTAHSVATLSTVSVENDYPYAVPMFYATGDGPSVFFVSHNDSRKIRNIAAHPHTGVTIIDTQHLTTLQLQGTAIVGNQDAAMIKKVLEIATTGSGDTLPPLMKIPSSSILLVSFSIAWYKLSSYSENKAVYFEGIIDQTS